MGGWMSMKVPGEPTSTHLRKRLSSSSRWCLRFTLRLHSCSNDLLTSRFFSKRLTRSSISLEWKHTGERDTGSQCSQRKTICFGLKVLFFFSSTKNNSRRSVVFEHFPVFLQLCLAAVQFFRFPLSSSTEIYLEELQVYVELHYIHFTMLQTNVFTLWVFPYAT